MSENSKIQWTHHTFNPWRGCTKVSPGCDHCYAESGSKRNPKVLGVWGDDGTRPTASEAYWREPLRWNRDAEAAGERRRVFCASLADVGEDRPDLVAPRARLSELILATPWLDWLLLTKRIENMVRLFPWDVLARCYVGTTTENQEQANARIPALLETPARVRFISGEPLLGPLDLTGPPGGPGWLTGHDDGDCPMSDPECLGGDGDCHDACERQPRIDWVIVGGESGHGARPFHRSWAESLVDQVERSGVALFMKQAGANFVDDVGRGADRTFQILDSKGGNPAEWPPKMRVRQFPAVRA